ncbi:MAG: DUF3108 domain-containing protein [Alphaproteobacteria bacterium]
MRWLCPALLAGAVLHASCAVAAGPETIDLAYDVSVAGVPALGLRLEVDVRPDRYQIASVMETRGFIGLLFPWTMQSEVRGVVVGDVLRPVDYRFSSVLYGTERTARLRFAPDGSVTTETNHVSGDEDRAPVPPEMRRGSVDVLTGILRVTRRLDRTGLCTTTVPVFDGRRRYDLLFSDAPLDAANPRHVRTCVGSINRIAGFLKSAFAWGDDDDGRAASISAARIFPGAPLIPFRLEFGTPVGVAYAQLQEARHRGKVLAGAAIRPLDEGMAVPPKTGAPTMSGTPREDPLMLPRGD